jgi:hypothetical protein
MDHILLKSEPEILHPLKYLCLLKRALNLQKYSKGWMLAGLLLFLPEGEVALY